MSNAHSPEKGVGLDADRLKLALDAFYGDDAYSTTLDGIRAAITAWEASKPAVEKAAPDLLAFLTSIVDEFGGTIAQYHKIGPDFTFKDGTEVFEVSVVLGRASLIDEARAAIARATEGV